MPKPDITIEVDAKRLKMIDNVRTYARDIESFESRIKTITGMIKDIVDQIPETDAVTALEEQLKLAREAQKRALMSKPEYVDATTELGEERDALKGAKNNLSDALLVWFTKTGEHQVELAAQKAREVIISGKLGKEQLYQPSLFGAAHE